MLYLLVTPSCSGCVKAKNFFQKNKIPFQEINFFKKSISPQLLLDILQMTENGVYDIISSRAKYLLNNKISIDDITINELLKLIKQHPSILKRPLIIQYDNSSFPKRLMIGYNEDDIQVFNRELKLSAFPETIYSSEFSDASLDESVLPKNDQSSKHKERWLIKFFQNVNFENIDDYTLIKILYERMPNSVLIQKLYTEYVLTKDLKLKNLQRKPVFVKISMEKISALNEMIDFSLDKLQKSFDRKIIKKSKTRN